jgi:hypothetical protein
MKMNEYKMSKRTNQNHADYIHNLLAAKCIDMIYCEEEENESEAAFENRENNFGCPIRIGFSAPAQRSPAFRNFFRPRALTQYHYASIEASIHQPVGIIMGKKKRGHPDVEELLARPWCYYCTYIALDALAIANMNRR